MRALLFVAFWLVVLAPLVLGAATFLYIIVSAL